SNPNLVNFDENNDIICLACHNKEGWVDSAHASEQVANETYNATAASERDFPAGIQVWQAACLNCHDTHTVAGSRRLLREGTTDVPPSGQVIKAGGGTPAIEETCYQCHANSADPYYVLDGSNPQVPDIKSDFQLARHMPITSAEQPANTEVHDIGNTGNSGDGKEMIETPLTLGKGNLMNRHAECTDCHNPHRVTKNRLATDAPSIPAAAGTHDHNLTDGATEHSNLISGVLRGTWGVEPSYGASPFGTLPINYTLKSGVPPQNGSNLVTEAYVTREYQVCLKCHSDYGFDDANPPALGYYAGGTPSGTNGVIYYTNQAMEFQAPIHHQGSPSTNDSGAAGPETASAGYRYWVWMPQLTGYGWRWNKIQHNPSNTMTERCDSNDDSGCSCEECTGPPVGDTFPTGITCGIADINTFASTGMPGNPGSPWDGSLWDGDPSPDTTVTPPYPYTARKCQLTTDYTQNNHRSWHPVMKETGRDASIRKMNANNFLPPFNAAVGSQTMYCSDCHGSDTGTGTVVPDGGEDGSPWGPHGSDNNFLLKGEWSELSGGANDGGSANQLCFKCHDWNQYANAENTNPQESGFRADPVATLWGIGCMIADIPLMRTNLHVAHATIWTGTAGLQCTWCHAAVPHGWKNKALLVNLMDLGPEAGLPTGTVLPGSYNSSNTFGGYTNAPYYLNAKLRIVNFKQSGEWTRQDCEPGGMSMFGCALVP
ncbi:Cytochrome c family protein, partial [hydrothermal vent metagenome]